MARLLPRMSIALPSRRTILIGAVTVAAGVVALWTLTGRPAAQGSKAAPVIERPVQVHVVRFSAGDTPRTLVGVLRARFEVEQGFRVAGKMIERRVQAGSRVKAGDILARLDDTDLRLQLELAEAELAAARSSEHQAELERDRIAALRRQGWSTEQVFDKQKAILDEASARRKRAERQVSLAENGLSYALLKAEGDGIVTAAFAEAGQVVSAGLPIMRLARDGDREAQVAIPEHELDFARSAKASIALWAAPDRSHPAQLRELTPSADPATRTFSARYSLEGLPPDTTIGMSVVLSLSQSKSTIIARVPLSAILNEGKGTEVFVVDPASGQLVRRAIVIRSFDAREAFVSEGLSEGDNVVSLGVHTLQAGQKVRIAPAARNG